MIGFKAKIRNSDGSEEVVIIEIQKAKLPTDIMRFRKYLGLQYSDNNNVYKKVNEFESTRALPIVSISFLGHTLQHTEVPVIKVNREYIDISTKAKITEKEEFIECLTHDSYIIQIPYLKKKRQTELLQVLSVFDQDTALNDKHILKVNTDDLPEKYAMIIRRLQSAMADEELKRKMDVEDLILEDMQNTERKMAILENEVIAKNKTIEKNKIVLEEKDRIIAELLKKINDDKG
ncbi:MAG: hypothetical protein JXR48_06440 [Candidatus Delongbacteria bacterium]|nr:hypothetical protein [Candidatus Delongbacteria bacterium]